MFCSPTLKQKISLVVQEKAESSQKGKDNIFLLHFCLALTCQEFFGSRFDFGSGDFPKGEIVESHNQIRGHQFAKLAH